MIRLQIIQAMKDFLELAKTDTSLVALTGHVDSKDNTVPTYKEVNAAIADNDSIRIQRNGNDVTLGSAGTQMPVTEAEMKHAAALYMRKYQ